VLNSPRRDNTLADSARSLSGCSVGNRRDRHSRHFDDQIDSVAKRPGDAAVIPCNIGRRAPANALFFPAKTTRARVHRGNEHETSGKDGSASGARNRHAAFFKRLSHHFEDAAVELGHLVEEENTVVRERDLAGPWSRTTTNERDIRDGVVRRPKRTPRQQPGIGRKRSGNRVDGSALERFFKGQRWKDARQTASKHRLARAWWTHKQQIVSPRRCNFERSAGK
jgi:hypothetical protein